MLSCHEEKLALYDLISLLLATTFWLPKIQVRKEWKVKGAMFGTLDGRVTYVIDKNGVVTSMYDNLLDGASHSKEALAALKG